MKAVQINGYGGEKVIEINTDAPMVAAQPGKVLVEVHAAGVNPMDWKVRDGLTRQWINLNFPATLGYDFSGIVADVGEGVTDFRRGNEVYGEARIAMGGSFAEYVLTDADAVAIKPGTVNHIESAALPLAGVSAYQAIVEVLNLSPEQKILIHGGAGGIGSYAIQLASHLGAFVATTVRGSGVEFAKRLGADMIINFEKEKFGDLVHEYDAVLDTVGGNIYTRSYEVLRVGGIILSMTEGPRTDLEKKYDVKAMPIFTEVNSGRLKRLAEFVDKSVVKVYIDRVFPLDKAADAITYLKKGRPNGKVVIAVKERVPDSVVRQAQIL